MPRGVKIEEVLVGTGPEATRRSTVIANVRSFLSQGEELPPAQNARIDLFKREVIAGLRLGIEGMRVGGKRALKISPHLAYGATAWRE